MSFLFANDIICIIHYYTLLLLITFPQPTRRPIGSSPNPRPPTRNTPRPSSRPTRRPSNPRPSDVYVSDDCVDVATPRPVRDGQRFRFSLEGSNARCVDNRDRAYEFGQFDNTNRFSDCAEKCVNETPNDLATSDTFRGFDFDCNRRTCRCLYDEGTLDSRNSGRFDRTNRNENGRGSISGTSRRTYFYCGILVGAELIEGAVAE